MRINFTLLLASAAVCVTAMAGSAEAHVRHHHHFHHTKHLHSKHHGHGRAHFPEVSQATRDNVISLIKAEAPRSGVPTWFALRIAKVESGYNPLVTGGEGEIGVFQMKCQTARGIGYTGSCAGLYNPATNVHWGLRHLSMAVKASHGNLRLAASMHNGGLGCRHIVRAYVAMIF